ncbi:class I SAM-dependent methyltransferase [Fontivita pretiosa]|uniref:class I SAM-dependent methyltransferase n=1 Tax=Fontivita pretiosa TaxID=2989684 RepID=UPI003D177884
MPQHEFDELAEIYEAMIDWPRRLANEQPLFRWVFERVGARRVLDAACGTGHHAAMFHSWGMEVEAADVSAAMIERCRSRWGQSDSLRWIVRAFDQSILAGGESSRPFDVIVCIGQSLALAPDRATVARALSAMLAAVRRDGGAVLVHVLNLWKLPDGPCVWQKCRRVQLPGAGDSLIIKGVQRCGDRGYVNVLATRLDTHQPTLRSESVPFLGLEAEELHRIARAAGAVSVEFFGDYQRSAYDRAASTDLIMLATR